MSDYCGICGIVHADHHNVGHDWQPERIHAPFRPDQVEALNRWQQRVDVHPFTCDNHRANALVATPNGWVCELAPACNYTQDWAHQFMARDGQP